MYQVKKYADCNAVHDLDSEKSRKLTDEEWEKILIEHPALVDDKCVSIFTDTITVIDVTSLKAL